MSESTTKGQAPVVDPDEGRPRRKRAREFVMDAFDDAAFSYALGEAFSTVEIEDDYWEGAPPSERPLRNTIAESRKSGVLIRVPKFEAGVGSEACPDWAADRAVYSFRYFRSSWYWHGKVESRWPFKPPFLRGGRLAITWFADDPAGAATASKVWHLLVRVSTNSACLAYPAGEAHAFSGSRYGTRYGFHALDWCTQNPDSVIGNRIRPPADWSVPKSKWYRSLWDRVVDDYGEDFADPHKGGPLANVAPRNPPPVRFSLG